MKRLMATPKSQRIGIWIIAVVMLVGTIGSFAVMILANSNQAKDAATQQQQQDQANAQVIANAKNNKPLDGYSVTPFDKASITDLKVDTLVQGTGTPATATSTLTVEYFGWTSNGTIFDSSNKSGTTKPTSLSLSGVIPGWTTGLTGVKAGSTVKLTLPAAQAYGATGSPPLIGANEPLMFIVTVQAVK
jgi:FKBP-type peptidyl-prolyl cis-trans isomerase